MLKKAFLNNRKKVRVGIAINTSQLIFTIVEQTKKQLHVVEQGKYQIEDVIYALHEIKKLALSYPCHLALPHRFVMLKTLLFSDHFKEREINELLVFNSEAYFAHPTEKIYFDFELLDKLKKRVRVIASKKEYVMDWVNLFAEAKLNLKIISLDVLAAEKFLLYHRIVEEKKIYAVFIVMGKEFLQIVIVEGHVCFVNSVIISEQEASFFQQEISKFFRLYESSKSFFHSISHIVVLGADLNIVQKIREKITLPMMIDEEFGHAPLENVAYLLPLGMALAC